MSSVHTHNYVASDRATMPFRESFPELSDLKVPRQIWNRATLRKFKRGEVVIAAGQDTDAFARVQRGLVAATAVLSDGREFIMEVIAPNGLIGDVEVLQGKAISMEYRAISDCAVSFVDGRWLRETCANDARVREDVFSRALARVSELERRIVSAAGSSLQGRVAATLLRLAVAYSHSAPGHLAEIKISQNDLAAMVPASREKVNQCLRRLRETGVIAGSPGTIRIINQSALQYHANGAAFRM